MRLVDNFRQSYLLLHDECRHFQETPKIEVTRAAVIEDSDNVKNAAKRDGIKHR